MTDIARGLTLSRIRQIATGGTASIGFSVAATNLLRIVSTMTLSRLLDSYAYGVVGVITSIAFMLAMLSDIGLGPFTVRHADGDDETFLDQLWTIRVVRGLVLAVAMAVVAGPISAFIGEPELKPVVAVYGLIFLLDGVHSMAPVTGIRRRQFWRLSVLDLLGNVFTFFVSLTMAFALHSYWAMIIGMLGGAIAKLIFSYVLFPRSSRRWHYSRARAQELWLFSRYIMLSSMMTLVIMQADKVVLARLMPLAVFGIYSIAVTLAAAPSALALPYVTRVLYPIYSETARNSPHTLREVFYRTRRKTTLLYMFGTGGVIGAAPVLVGLLYDPRYAGVSQYLRLIMISAVLILPSQASEQALIATGRTKANLFSNICRITWLVVGCVVGLKSGEMLLLIAFVGTLEVPGMLCNWVNLYRAGLFDMREESYGLLVAMVGIALGYLFSWGAFALFPGL